MQYVMTFEYQNHEEFRIIDRDGEPWFVLADVCQALDLQTKKGSYYHHAERLDADEKETVPRAWVERNTSPRQGGVIGRGAPRVIVISESGLYSLILTSNKPEAKRFKKWITSEVLPAIRKTGSYRGLNKTPAFIKRYNANWDRVEAGHFSVINELTTRFWGRLEMVGHVMADKAPDGKELRPDVSVERLFSEWLSENHPAVSDEYSFYVHVTPEWEGEVRQYPNRLLPLFVEFVDAIWIPEHSPGYMRKRDPAALPYLPKLLPPPTKRPALTPPRARLN